jgi:hypothetical protein
MTSSIVGISKDSSKSFHNNETLSQNSSKSKNQPENDSIPQEHCDDNSSTQVYLSYSQRSDFSLGLYDKYGSIPVSAVYNADGESDMSSSNNEELSDGAFIASGGFVVVDIQNSGSGYHKIYWSTDNFKTKVYICFDDDIGSYEIGNFIAGTKIHFEIDNGQGDFFRTGSASNNADNVLHATAISTSSGMQIGFEGFFGGGEQEFSDVLIYVRNLYSPEYASDEGYLGADNEELATNSSNQDIDNLNNSAKLVQYLAKKAQDPAALALLQQLAISSQVNNNNSVHRYDTSSGQDPGMVNSQNTEANETSLDSRTVDVKLLSALLRH